MNTTMVSLALFLFLNLLCCTLASVDPACNCDTPSKHKHKHHKHKPKSPSTPKPFPSPPMQYPKPPGFPLPSTSPPLPFPRTPSFPLPAGSPPFPFPQTPGFPLPSTTPPFPFPRTPGFPLPSTSPPKTTKADTCPRDALKFEACSGVLDGVVGSGAGTPPKKPCCRLFGGLVEFEAAVCICTAIKANVLGFNLNAPVAMSMVLNICDMKAPPGFQCA